MKMFECCEKEWQEKKEEEGAKRHWRHKEILCCGSREAILPLKLWQNLGHDYNEQESCRLAQIWADSKKEAYMQFHHECKWVENSFKSQNILNS